MREGNTTSASVPGRAAIRERVGVIGLGVMGRPIARRLIESGASVTVYSLDAGASGALEELAGIGARPAADSWTVASASDIVVSVLPDDEAVLAAIDEALAAGAVRPGTLWIDLSTTRPDTAREAASRMAQAGAQFMDAPMSGGQTGAESGALSIMVGGSDEALRRAQPVLEWIAATITHVGPIGAGQLAKACNQLLVIGTLLLTAEALSLAHAGGSDPRRVLDAVSGGYAGSALLQEAGRRMIAGDFRPGGRLGYHAKDIATIRAIVAEASIEPLAGFEVAAAKVEQLIEDGQADSDHAVLGRAFGERPETRDVNSSRVTVAAEAGVETHHLPGRIWTLLLGPQNSPSRRMTMSRAVFPPGSAPGQHVHEREDEVVYVIAGQGRLWTPDGPIPLWPGSAFHVPARLLHGAVNDGDVDLELLCVFSPPVVPGSYDPAPMRRGDDGGPGGDTCMGREPNWTEQGR